LKVIASQQHRYCSVRPDGASSLRGKVEGREEADRGTTAEGGGGAPPRVVSRRQL
jgi:hypothetical protein